MKRITLFFMCLLLGGALWAQNIQVSGVVTDAADGQPIPGAVVLVVGTKTTSLTDANGRYTILVPANGSLEFSSMNVKTVIVSVEGKSLINVELEPATVQLDEVVLTGYGSQRKGTVTGSVSVIKAAQLDQVPIANLQQMLQGGAPGVQATATSGRPGSGATIKIRGTGSISAGSNPLYVIDGIALSVTDFAAINSNDIESMTILKDASATSIYGSRGANGVIVITTKQGAAGRTKVTARAQYGVINKTNDKFDVMNAKEILLYENRLGRGKGAGMTVDQINAYDGVNTNWIDEMFRTGSTQTYEISLSGGDQKTKFYISGQYYSQDGIAYGSSLDRITGRANLTHEVSKKINVGINMSVGHYKESIIRESRNALNPMFNAYKALPYTYPFEPDGSYHVDNYMDSNINIFQEIDKAPDIHKSLRGIGSFFVNWKPIEQLSFKSTLGLDFLDFMRYYYVMPTAGLAALLSNPQGNGPAGSTRNDQNQKHFTYSWANTLTFQDTYADVHNIKVTGGVEITQYQFQSISASRTGFVSEAVDALSSGSTVSAATGGFNGYSLASFFLYASYDYDSKYLLDASIRRDGASRFGPNNRWGTFFSIGAGWNVHQENFMQSMDVISKLKIRGSYGTSGNFNIGNYAWRGTFAYGSYDAKNTTFQTAIANKDLTWETNYQFSIGFDFGLFEDRIGGSFDWYNRDTKDLLLAAQLSRTSGFSSRTENIGHINNKGIEINLRGDIIKTKDWLWALQASYSHNKNKVVKLASTEPMPTNSGLTMIQEGSAINTYYLTRYAGVDPATGVALFLDKEGNISSDQTPDFDVLLDGKTPDPKHFGTFGSNLSWKSLELNATFYYSYGNYIFNLTRWNFESDGSEVGKANHPTRLLYDAWQKPGDITDIPKQSLTSNTPATTRFLEDGSYIRLRNVTLSYSLPKKWISAINLEKVRIYAQGENLFTITKFKGFDPEIGTHAEGTAWSAGSVEDFNYPVGRAFTLGLDITF